MTEYLPLEEGHSPGSHKNVPPQHDQGDVSDQLIVIDMPPLTISVTIEYFVCSGSSFFLLLLITFSLLIRGEL